MTESIKSFNILLEVEYLIVRYLFIVHLTNYILLLEILLISALLLLNLVTIGYLAPLPHAVHKSKDRYEGQHQTSHRQTCYHGCVAAI